MAELDGADEHEEDDGLHNVARTNDDFLMNAEKKQALTLINTNARSLCPKFDSLVECFEELHVVISIVTETWFRDGEDLELRLFDLEHGFGLRTLTKNRAPDPVTGVAHGGVAIFLQEKYWKL